MGGTIYDELGGFMTVRKLITQFYENVLDCDELAVYFENVNMERQIDHQTKFFSGLLGGPASFTDEELRMVHKRLGLSNKDFDLTKECLVDALEEFDMSDEHIEIIAGAFEGKRALIVQTV